MWLKQGGDHIESIWNRADLTDNVWYEWVKQTMKMSFFSSIPKKNKTKIRSFHTWWATQHNNEIFCKLFLAFNSKQKLYRRERERDWNITSANNNNEMETFIFQTSNWRAQSFLCKFFICLSKIQNATHPNISIVYGWERLLFYVYFHFATQFIYFFPYSFRYLE